MTNATMNGANHNPNEQFIVRLATATIIKDAGRVCLGGQSPAFRTISIVDQGRIRLGGQGPVLRRIADAGNVRLGGQGPIFR